MRLNGITMCGRRNGSRKPLGSSLESTSCVLRSWRDWGNKNQRRPRWNSLEGRRKSAKSKCFMEKGGNCTKVCWQDNRAARNTTCSMSQKTQPNGLNQRIVCLTGSVGVGTSGCGESVIIMSFPALLLPLPVCFVIDFSVRIWSLRVPHISASC